MRLFRKLVLVVGLMGLSAAAGSAFTRSAAGARLFADVQRIVSSQYIDSLPEAEIYRRAAEGLVAELGDPYSELYPPADMDEFTSSHMGRYGGVGMEILALDGFATVNQLFPETPAERAGLQVGDRIVEVDGTEVAGWPLERVTERLRGEAGTPVDIRVRRGARPETIAFRVTRAIIHVPPVPYTLLLEDEVGYVPLVRFWEGAGQGVAEAVRELEARGAKSIVLDLRGNGGGLMDEAVAVSSVFLPRGRTVVEQRERDRRYSYRAEGTPPVTDLPLAILVDEGTASASEIVAGALQDYDRAVVVGERTFGKGVVQSTFALDGGYMLKLTTGSWYTPLGRSLDRGRRVVNGRIEEDSAVASGPTVRTRSGRELPADGGVTPDVTVVRDTLSSAAQAFARAVGPHAQAYLAALDEVATELRGSAGPELRIRPEWRERLYAALLAREVVVPRELFDAAAPHLDLALGSEIARGAGGRAAAKAWSFQEDDALVRAVDLLRGRTRQSEVFSVLEPGR